MIQSPAFRPELIEVEAKRLENAAQLNQVLYSFFGILLGLACLAATARFDITIRVFLAFIPAIVFVALGDSRARQLRFQAQTIRLHLQIERNTSLLMNVLHALTPKEG